MIQFLPIIIKKYIEKYFIIIWSFLRLFSTINYDKKANIDQILSRFQKLLIIFNFGTMAPSRVKKAPPKKELQRKKPLPKKINLIFQLPHQLKISPIGKVNQKMIGIIAVMKRKIKIKQLYLKK